MHGKLKISLKPTQLCDHETTDTVLKGYEVNTSFTVQLFHTPHKVHHRSQWTNRERDDARVS